MSEMVQDRHPGTRGPRTRGPQDSRTRDSRTPGLADPGTRGPRDKWNDTEGSGYWSPKNSKFSASAPKFGMEEKDAHMCQILPRSRNGWAWEL